MKTPTVLALALALAFTGCIQNMSGLKGALSASDEPLDPASAPLEAPPDVANVTSESANASREPPVARMSVFGPNGALLFKSTFQADDPNEVVLVPEDAKLNLIAGDSEALASGATLAGFTWTLDGKPVEGARQASITVGAPALYVVKLTVTDSNGKSDAHIVKLGVAPKPYEVTLEIMTGPIGGAEGEGVAESHPFTLAADASQGPSMVQKVVVTASPDLLLDAKLLVLDAEGATLGEADEAGHDSLDQTESVELGALALGEYAVAIEAFAGADPDGVPITITVTYLPMIAGVNDMGDGHGGHA